MVGLMTAVSGLDETKGSDLIIHTPGGSPYAAESIVKCLHNKFGNDIEVFIPHMAMSAGTMISCASKNIWMGRQSSLGPIDPQFDNIPAYNIKKQFEDAKEDLTNNPKSREYWEIALLKYLPAINYRAIDAINLSSELVNDWLINYMFQNDLEANLKAKKIIETINVNTGSHSKHFSQNDCMEMGLKITRLESDLSPEDKLLSIYYSLQITGDCTNVSKIIENNLGKSYICYEVQK